MIFFFIQFSKNYSSIQVSESVSGAGSCLRIPTYPSFEWIELSVNGSIPPNLHLDLLPIGWGYIVSYDDSDCLTSVRNFYLRPVSQCLATALPYCRGKFDCLDNIVSWTFPCGFNCQSKCGGWSYNCTTYNYPIGSCVNGTKAWVPYCTSSFIPTTTASPTATITTTVQTTQRNSGSNLFPIQLVVVCVLAFIFNF